MHKIFLFTCFLALSCCITNHAQAQLGNRGGGGLNRQTQTGETGPQKPKEYEIGGIRITGNTYLDADLIEAVTNLSVSQKVSFPNDESIAKAIKALWKQELFSNIIIYMDVSEKYNSIENLI